MSKRGPILLLEDDTDDQELLQEVFESLAIKNELKFFSMGPALLSYLQTTDQQPFIIISDVNLPGMTGTEVAQRIHDDPYLRQKSIPFIFLTTSANKTDVTRAYEVMVQGYFQKEHKFEQVKKMIGMIIDYWSICRHPNNIDG